MSHLVRMRHVSDPRATISLASLDEDGCITIPVELVEVAKSHGWAVEPAQAKSASSEPAAEVESATEASATDEAQTPRKLPLRKKA